jgi:ribosomal protein S27E
MSETLKESVPQPKWSVHASGQSKYYNANADNLYAACEILKQLSSIPPMTYYTVTTPDGTLCKDIVDFYTEAPLKTKGLRVKHRSLGKDSEAVDALSLIQAGDMLKANASVANLKSAGEYAKLILMMKCGHCGYESPVETEQGDIERECYFCGSTIKTTRGGVTVYTANGAVNI